MSEDELKPEVKSDKPKQEVKADNPLLEAKTDKSKAEVKAVEPKVTAKTDEPKADTKVPAPKPNIRNSIIFALAIIGILAGLIGAYIFSIQRKAQPPVFSPVTNPYSSGIYANGMIESYMTSGENINIFTEVSGPIVKVLV